MPNVKTYYLTNSYRSSPKISNIANSLITYNSDRLLKKPLKSCISDDNSSVLCSNFETDADMYEQVIRDHQEFSKIKNTSTVVLSRVNSLINKTSRLVKLLDISHTNYQVPKSQRLFGQLIILNVSAYLKFIYSQSDDVSLNVYLMFQKEALALKLYKYLKIYAYEYNFSLYEAVRCSGSVNLRLKISIKNSIFDFIAMISKLILSCKNKLIPEIIQNVYEQTGL
ncbi:MAG: hypothetical protein LBN01_04375 [Endomicrobium sp.]|jgi:superfamily I DNA/RNA helicase|nr:hypothetical protein [Endomicrobium sp.]